jgi:cytochrome c5
MNRLLKTIAILATITFCATAVLAAEGGNPKKGKYLYKKECKTCHVAGAEGGALTPLSKTMSQWDRFFDRDKHQAKPEVWTGFSEKDLKDIQQFLFDHAADSDQPQTCG